MAEYENSYNLNNAGDSIVLAILERKFLLSLRIIKFSQWRLRKQKIHKFLDDSIVIAILERKFTTSELRRCKSELRYLALLIHMSVRKWPRAITTISFSYKDSKFSQFFTFHYFSFGFERIYFFTNALVGSKLFEKICKKWKTQKRWICITRGILVHFYGYQCYHKKYDNW